jgi:hypothetical protein
MNVVGFLIIGSLAVVTLVVIGWFLTARKLPENASEHHERDRAPRTFEAGRGDLDGDPGAEVMDPRLLGGDQSTPDP